MSASRYVRLGCFGDGFTPLLSDDPPVSMVLAEGGGVLPLLPEGLEVLVGWGLGAAAPRFSPDFGVFDPGPHSLSRVRGEGVVAVGEGAAGGGCGGAKPMFFSPGSFLCGASRPKPPQP